MAATEVVGASRAADDVERGRYAPPPGAPARRRDVRLVLGLPGHLMDRARGAAGDSFCLSNGAEHRGDQTAVSVTWATANLLRGDSRAL